MENFRFLSIRNVQFNKDPTHLQESLTSVINWSGYYFLRISEPIQGLQGFICLTVLDFTYCKWISHIPDVSGLPNLKKLSFKYCENLIQIHDSVGFLDNLRILDASHCKNLKTLPPIRSTSLVYLNISYCSNIVSLPKRLGKIENTVPLHMMEIPMKKFPFSFQNPTQFQKLKLENFGMVLLPRISEPIQGFMCLTVLDFSYCEWITHIPDVSGLPNLKKLSFKYCENLIQIHDSVGFLDKLRILDAFHCKKLRAFPPIRLTSLEHLNLSCCSSLESFPEILGKMENIIQLHIMGSPIKKLPFSIQNLTRLQKLKLEICGMVHLPSSIVMLSELGWMCVSRCEWLWLSKQDKGEELESKSSNTECLIFSYCNISDDFLPIGLTWFANVKDLDLSGNNFTILNACIKECHFLRNLKLDDCRLIQEVTGIPWKLEMFSAKRCTLLKYIDLTGECHSLRKLLLDDCVYLQEILGFPPNLEHFSAKNCTSLTSQCTSMFLIQELVEAGNKMFSLPGTNIPDWFTYCTSGETVSFWFRGKFPAISLCLVIGHVGEQPFTVKFSPRIVINGLEQYLGSWKVHKFRIATDHILLFDVRLLKFEDSLDISLVDDWNQMEVSYVDHITNEVPIRLVAKFSGIHVLKQTGGMGDIRFTCPYKKRITAKGKGPHQTVKTLTERPQKDQSMVLSSPSLTSTQSAPPPAEAEKGLAPQLTFAVKRPLEDVEGKTSERLLEDEVHHTTIQNEPPVIERCHKDDDVELEGVSSCECYTEDSSNSKGSDSDDPLGKVYSKITRVPLHIVDYPVGLESRVLKVNLLLNVGSDDVVHMVGIHGMDGIGKTSIAWAVYNLIYDQFEGFCFLDNVRENSTKYSLLHLQQMLLFEIVGDKDINLQNVDEGISIIKHRLYRRKVLLVLDDVDKIEQLQAIVGGPDWFGPGSRVIITTQDKHLLASHGVESTYEVEELSEEEALDLLRWSAFKANKVDPSYANVLKRAVTYASRLPLALELMGSYLFGGSINSWNHALDQYEQIPDKKIQKILKVSFDSLQEKEKAIFLDIACFFNGHKLADIEDILSAHHGISMKYCIELLIEKSLVKIDDGLVTLHDLIQDMGREIVRQESPNELGKRSRLWLPKDVVRVLETNTGSSTIESLVLDFPKDELHLDGPDCEEVYWDGEAFKNMTNLKTLIIRNCHFSKGPTHLPNSLRVLKWWNYPSSSLPSDFDPKDLAILELPDSFLTTSEPIQRFRYLTVLDFGYCELITRIPDVSGLPNLEKLSVKHCENLNEIHKSVGFLDKLRILDAVCCVKLGTFPPIRLTSLELLNLSHCLALESFPEISGKMENITELHVVGSPIKELPFSIRNLTRLRKLELQFCGMVQLPSSILMMLKLSVMHVSRCEGLWLSKLNQDDKMVSSNTECLILSYCNISDEFLPIGLAWFANVKDLNLSGNNFTILPTCFKECRFLRNLTLDDCRLLQEISGIPWNLETLSAKGCTSLKDLDLTILPASPEEYHSLRELILDDCVHLREIKGILPNLDHFSSKNCTFLTSWCTSILLNQEPVEAGNKMFVFPGSKSPEWLTHCTRGGSISFWFHNKFPTISLCLVIGPVDEHPIMVKFSPVIFINGNKLSIACQKVYEFRIATDHVFLFDLQLPKFEDNVDTVCSEKEWSRVDVSYADHITKDAIPINLVTKQIGIHIFKETDIMANILFANPHSDEFLLMSESMEGSSHQRVKTKPEQPQKALAIMPSSPILTSTQPSLAGAQKGQASPPAPSFERFWDGEVHPTAIQNDSPVNEEGIGSDDVEVAAMSSNSESSDSDDPFDLVNTELSVNEKQTMSSGVNSGDASLTSIQEAMEDFELVMVKDLSEVSSDPATQFRLDHLLDLLSTSSHPMVTEEVKEDLINFKRKAFASFQEFQANVESVNKLKNFKKQRARIQQETVAGKDHRKDLRNSIKKASLAIKAENSRKKELEAEIETLRKQLAVKETDLEQLVLNVKNQEATLSTYSRNYASLNDLARVLLKEAVDLVAANTGVEDEGEAAEINQNRLKSAWSTDLTSQYIKIRKKILGRYE